MTITYQQAKDVAIDLSISLTETLDVAGHISAEYWSMDDYVFVITASGKFKFEVPEDMIGEGFPE